MKSMIYTDLPLSLITSELDVIVCTSLVSHELWLCWVNQHQLDLVSIMSQLSVPTLDVECL